jgi:hypothetical protein
MSCLQYHQFVQAKPFFYRSVLAIFCSLFGSPETAACEVKSFCWRLLRCVPGAGEWVARRAGRGAAGAELLARGCWRAAAGARLLARGCCAGLLEQGCWSGAAGAGLLEMHFDL